MYYRPFKGTIMAAGSITMNDNATMDGRALAESGSVTFGGVRGSLPAPQAPIFTRISSANAESVPVVLRTAPHTLDDGQRDVAFDDSRRDGVAGEARRVVDIELAHEMGAVLFDGLDADAQLDRDLLVSFALGNQLEHLDLARTQVGALRLWQAFPVQ